MKQTRALLWGVIWLNGIIYSLLYKEPNLLCDILKTNQLKLISKGKWLIFSPLLQVRAHQLVLPPCEVVIKAVSEYVSSIKDLGNLDAIARDVFKQSQVRRQHTGAGDPTSAITDVPNA